jgi:hypothetical protein
MASATKRLVEKVVKVEDGVTLELTQEEAHYIYLLTGQLNGLISQSVGLSGEVNKNIYTALSTTQSYNSNLSDKVYKALKEYFGR